MSAFKILLFGRDRLRDAPRVFRLEGNLEKRWCDAQIRGLMWRYDFGVKRTLSLSRNSPKKLENESQAASLPSASPRRSRENIDDCGAPFPGSCALQALQACR
jgi:hypothetical protein